MNPARPAQATAISGRRAAPAPTPVSGVGLVAIAVLAMAALAGCAAPPAEEPADELSGTVIVLAAASLTETFELLEAAFEDAHPDVDVVFSFGGSSALAEQIVTGGVPADVFAAANESTMQTVSDAELAVDPELFATNVLALAVPAGNPAGVAGLADLARGELAIALCDVAVPCGSATTQLLELAGVAAAPDTLEPDVKAVLTRIELGEADAGLVYVTDVVAAGDAVEAVEVPEAAEVINRYPIAALAEAPNPDAAAAFVAYVLGPAGRAALEAAGFGLP